MRILISIAALALVCSLQGWTVFAAAAPAAARPAAPPAASEGLSGTWDFSWSIPQEWDIVDFGFVFYANETTGAGNGFLFGGTVGPFLLIPLGVHEGGVFQAVGAHDSCSQISGVLLSLTGVENYSATKR